MAPKVLLALGLTAFLAVGCAETSRTNSSDPTAETASAAELELSQAKNAKVLAAGNFVKAEAATKGSVRVVNHNGKTYVELDKSFQTSDRGPDLFVVLHRSANVLGSTQPPAFALREQDYTAIAPLKQFSGAQRYEVPGGINLNDYKSVAIWCRKFNATFGVASLSR